jgi:hypothetical protein
LLVGGRRQKQIFTGVLAVLGLLVICGLGSGCAGVGAGNSNNSMIPGTPAGTYNVTVTAASGSLTHSTTLALVVR